MNLKYTKLIEVTAINPVIKNVNFIIASPNKAKTNPAHPRIGMKI